MTEGRLMAPSDPGDHSRSDPEGSERHDLSGPDRRALEDAARFLADTQRLLLECLELIESIRVKAAGSGEFPPPPAARP
jgi:hypothetical protein